MLGPNWRFASGTFICIFAPIVAFFIFLAPTLFSTANTAVLPILCGLSCIWNIYSFARTGLTDPGIGSVEHALDDGTAAVALSTWSDNLLELLVLLIGRYLGVRTGGRRAAQFVKEIYRPCKSLSSVRILNYDE